MWLRSWPEEHTKVTLTTKENSTEVTIQREPHTHIKSAGASIREKQKRKKEKITDTPYREISTAEMLWQALGLDRIICNANFVSCNTLPFEKRAAVKKHFGGSMSKKLTAENGQPLMTTIRNDMPPERQFDEYQAVLIEEYQTGDYYLDTTTTYSARPPELWVFDSLDDYLTFFTRTSCKKQEIKAAEDVASCPWIDGSGMRIRVARKHIADATEFLQQRVESDNSPLNCELLALFRRLRIDASIEPPSEEVQMFVDLGADKENILVYNTVAPYDFNVLATHMVLSLGRFKTELETFSGHNFADAFQRAQLVQDKDNINQSEINEIMKRYTLRHLAYYPLGCSRFEFYFNTIYENLNRFLSGNEVSIIEMPKCTERALQLAASQKLQEIEETYLKSMVDVIYAQPIRNKPPKQAILSRTQVDFQPNLRQRTINQTEECAQEQHAAAQICFDAIDRYLDPLATSTVMPLLIGAPGVGKTYVMLNANLYALSKSLRTMVTAMTAERARVLGGQHIHLLFGIPKEDSNVLSADITADRSIQRLLKSTVRNATLKRIDVLFVEEISLINTHMLSTMDNVLKNVKQSNKPFGGTLIIATGDHCQLPPVVGSDIWLNNQSLFTTFRVTMMSQYVRSHADPNLQTLIDYLRQPTCTPQQVQHMLTIIKDNCQFVTMSQLPPNVLHVVSKNKAAEQIINRYLSSLRSDNTINKVIVKAQDFIEQNPGNPVPGDGDVTKYLNDKVKEPAELILHKNAVMRVTYNNTNSQINMPVFSQGQLVVITDISDACDQNKPEFRQTITVKLVEPGVRRVDVNNLPPSWKEAKLRRRETNPVMSPNLKKIHRRQFPLTYFVCTTIHKVIGETVENLATTIDKEDSLHGLWQKPQLTVLVSRVKTLDNLWFLGPVQSTLAAIKELVTKESKKEQYVDKTLRSLNTLHAATPIIEAPSSNLIESCQTTLPEDACGFVVMTVCQNNLNEYQLSQCIDLPSHMTYMNQAIDFPQKKAALRPYLLAAYVTGFSTNMEDHPVRRTNLLKKIKQKVTTYKRRYNGGNKVSSKVVLQTLIEKGIKSEQKTTDDLSNLRLIKCIKLHQKHYP